MNIIAKLLATHRLKKAIAMADDAYRAHPQRYYVMPTTDGRLIIVDRKNFRLLKRKRYISDTATVNDLLRECFYCTPKASGDGAMSLFVQKKKWEIYYRWYDVHRRMSKMRRRRKKEGGKDADKKE